MAFRYYSPNPSDNTELIDGTYIGPNMLRNKVRPALQQIAADGKALSDQVEALLSGTPGYGGEDEGVWSLGGLITDNEGTWSL